MKTKVLATPEQAPYHSGSSLRDQVSVEITIGLCRGGA